MTGNSDPPGGTEVPTASRGRVRSAAAGAHGKAVGSAERAVARYTQTRQRLDQTAAGHLQRRIAEIDLMRQALIFAALGLMLVIPLLISLAALLPLGSPDGIAAAFAHRLGLSESATKDLQQLFPSPQTVRGSVTWLGVGVSLISAFAWPAALQNGYELAWGLPSLGWRDRWRPLVWLLSFFAVIAASVASAALSSSNSGWVGVVLALVGFPVVVGWAWWGQYLLLGGRVSWRLLLPGAIAITIGLFGLRLYGMVFLSYSITRNYQKYGALGVVLMVLSTLIGFSVVMIGGAVVGVTLHEHPLRRVARNVARGDEPIARPHRPTPPSAV
jgi:membrane protein